MRVRRSWIISFAALAVIGLSAAGCENTQGTSADPDLTKDTVAYKDNDDPQNTGAGAGAVGKPAPTSTSTMGGEPASQAAVKGTDNPPANQ